MALHPAQRQLICNKLRTMALRFTSTSSLFRTSAAPCIFAAPLLSPFYCRACYHDSSPGLYTSMKKNHLEFWTTHDRGHDDALLLAAELRLLANAASDRAEMHAILAQQRDNWNKLFQQTLTAATLTAAIMAGLSAQQSSNFSLSLPALLLNMGCALMMSVINRFQPSQLAEEQRTAARLFKKLVNDINYALQLPTYLRQYTPALLEDSQHRLQALDRAFPMPLTPGGLDKFPSRVVPPILSHPTCNTSAPDQIICGSASTNINGWTDSITSELKEVATLLRNSDIQTYSCWAHNVVKVNKCLAIAAPTFAIFGAALNAATSLMGCSNLGVYAAMCSVLAAFAGSFSHDMQVGMVFELYRNSAGFYAEVEALIHRTLGAPVEQRENGVLFRRRVAYELGRDGEDGMPLVPTGAKTGGTLF